MYDETFDLDPPRYFDKTTVSPPASLSSHLLRPVSSRARVSSRSTPSPTASMGRSNSSQGNSRLRPRPTQPRMQRAPPSIPIVTPIVTSLASSLPRDSKKYYKNLGINLTSELLSSNESAKMDAMIKSAYYTQSRIKHPDNKNTGSAKAFSDLLAAWGQVKTCKL